MINPRDIKNFNRLVKISEKRFEETYLETGKYLISSMIINKNRFVVGFNNYSKTHPFTLQTKHYIISKHAEIDALSRWNFSQHLLYNSTIYLCGLTNSGNFCISSKPCNPCLTKLKEFGIKRVVYSSNLENKFTLNELFIPNNINLKNKFD